MPAESYQKLKSAFPDFKKMPEVYLKIADASFEQGEHDKAISRYMQFMELYPGHEEVPRAKSPDSHVFLQPDQEVRIWTMQW